jgi:hypothetical protein
MIYSVVRNFSPNADTKAGETEQNPATILTGSDQYADELLVSVGNVVAVRTVFADGWAIATNISTGDSGIFPLRSLVSEGDLGNRVESLGVVDIEV